MHSVARVRTERGRTGETNEKPLRLATFRAASLPRSSTRWTCHWFVMTSSTAAAAVAIMTSAAVTRLGHRGVAFVGLGLMANHWSEPTARVPPRMSVRKERFRVSPINRCYGQVTAIQSDTAGDLLLCRRAPASSSYRCVCCDASE